MELAQRMEAVVPVVLVAVVLVMEQDEVRDVDAV